MTLGLGFGLGEAAWGGVLSMSLKNDGMEGRDVIVELSGRRVEIKINEWRYRPLVWKCR